MADLEEIKSNVNIRDIKSSYIIMELFSFLHEKQKLNIIIYNKELQKIFSVDIEYYKIKAGKYKISEKNGKGKEYTIKTNKLIFEGEYLKGKRHGKGKEYYEDGKLKFEGEYIDGQIWIGKGYNKKGKIEFEIINGKGNIKEYDSNDQLKFEGEYINGKRNGKGKEYNNNDKLQVIGEYINGERNGKGKEYFLNCELKFEG